MGLQSLPSGFSLVCTQLTIERDDCYICFKSGNDYPIRDPLFPCDECLSFFEASANQGKIDLIYSSKRGLEADVERFLSAQAVRHKNPTALDVFGSGLSSYSNIVPFDCELSREAREYCNTSAQDSIELARDVFGLSGVVKSDYCPYALRQRVFGG